MGDIASNVTRLKSRIEKVCAGCNRSPDEITIVGVTKTFPLEFALDVAQAGITEIGENKIQEATDKISRCDNSIIRWNFIGSLQTNKAKTAAKLFHMVQSIDRNEIATALNEHSAKLEKKLDVLIQIDTTNEETKHGISPEQFNELFDTVLDLPNLNLRGVMAVGPNTEDETAVRNSFQIVSSLFSEKQKEGLAGDNFDTLSIGMSSDYHIAIEEGSTMIRVGTTIFGSRN